MPRTRRRPNTAADKRDRLRRFLLLLLADSHRLQAFLDNPVQAAKDAKLPAKQRRLIEADKLTFVLAELRDRDRPFPPSPDVEPVSPPAPDPG